MSNQLPDNLIEIRELSRRVHQLLSDPHPGLHTWVLMLHEAQRELMTGLEEYYVPETEEVNA